ncbi:MAG TPA: hypothetical protein VJH75_04440 [Patescibacteria group bacterium]|nr:hypothetical protein [Patescibacteria group bacterium]
MLRPREYEKFINPTDEEFQKQIRFKHEGKRRLNELKLPEERLHVGYEKEIDIAGDVSTIHGFDFIDGVIPEKKQELQQRGIKRKIRICDIGSGLGLFCDQLKHYHGLDTKIFGTSLRRKGDRGRKKSSTDALDKMGLERSKSRREEINKITDKTINRESRLVESLAELHNFPEFDIMFDTFGELYYSALDDVENKKTDFPHFFEKLKMALDKLMPGGTLYIGALGFFRLDRDKQDILYRTIWDNAENLEKKLNIKITFVSKTKQELINLVKNVLKPSADGTIAYERICLGLLELLNPNHRQIDINERKKMSKIFSLMCGHQSVQFTKN